MNVTEKLRLLREGYSIEDINTGNAKPFTSISESVVEDGFTLFTESVMEDINFVSEMNLDMMREADGDSSKKEGIFKKFINFIIEKIRQFRKFISEIFKKNMDKAKQDSTKGPGGSSKPGKFPFTAKDAYENIINNPDKTVTEIEGTMDKFKGNINNLVSNADKGFKANNIPLIISEDEFRILMWKRVINNGSINYKTDMDIMNYFLGGPKDVTINNQKQIDNALDFSIKFFNLGEKTDKYLRDLEDRMADIRVPNTVDDTIKLINMSANLIIKTFRDIVSGVNAAAGRTVTAVKSH